MELGTQNLELTADKPGERLDSFVARSADGVSRSAAQKLIENGSVLVNGAVAAKALKLREGDTVAVGLPEPEAADILPEDIPLDIVYEDADVIVVNKPKGMVVHPAAGNYTGTLVNALMYHCGDSLSGINGEIRPGIVHRIDKDTSGLLVVAKNDKAHLFLAEQLKAHSMKREYMAVVRGGFKEDEGVISAPLGRSPHDRKKQAVNGINARPAVTHYKVLERFDKFSLCRLALETGRTHQIRVHCAYLGHPVAGDTVYGGEKNACGLQGQCLHAKTLGFIHPATGEFMDFDSPLPGYFRNFLKKL